MRLKLRPESLVILLIALKGSAIQPAELQDRWIVWNVGQGQWVTHVLTDRCRHYDVGGESGSFFAIKKKWLNECGGKLNQILLSHWDYDHYANILQLVKNAPQVCWLSKPLVLPEKISAWRVSQSSIRHCLPESGYSAWQPPRAKNLNDSSTVFQDQDVLLPGDSGLGTEKIWAQEIRGLDRVRILVLGHHGSRTSTGSFLLNQMKSLRLTIASARYQKYRHPHTETLHRVRQRGVPLLRTEDWGNIHL